MPEASFVTDPFDKISEDLKATFRPQREWIDKRGLFLVSAFFLSGVGAGTWVASAYYDYGLGLLLSLLVILIGSGGFHLAFLGRPQRFWRMLKRPQSSWISRGMLGIAVFSPPALLYMLPYYVDGLSWGPDTAFGKVLLGLSLFGALWLLVYKGFVLAVNKAVPFWNTPLLPPLYLAYGTRGGLALLFVVWAVLGHTEENVELVKLWVVVSSGVLVLFYLSGMYGAGVTAQRSVLELLKGRASLAFYLGVVVLGLAAPIALGAISLFYTTSMAYLGLVGALSLVGDFYLTFSILKAGLYMPAFGEFSTVQTGHS